MFVRIKKIKNNSYGYLVENRWGPTGPRQKVNQYLGKLYLFEKKIIPTPTEIGSLTYPQAVRELVAWNLTQLDFTRDTMDTNKLKKQGIVVDLLTMTIQKSGKNILIKTGDGYICTPLLQRLIVFNSNGTEEEVGYDLARAFVDAGIEIPREIFLPIFEKVWKGN